MAIFAKASAASNEQRSHATVEPSKDESAGKPPHHYALKQRR
jgi:hypothetical protein